MAMIVTVLIELALTKSLLDAKQYSKHKITYRILTVTLQIDPAFIPIF